MKKLLNILCIMGIALNTHAQITITGADLPQAGMSFIVSNDTTPSSISLGEPSPTFQTWDFSSLGSDYLKSAVYGFTSNTPYSSDFPASNIYTYGPSILFSSFHGGAPVPSGDNGYMFWSSDSSGFKVIGWRADSGPFAGMNILENPTELLIGTPASLGSVFNDTSRWELPMNINSSDVDTFFITQRTKTLTCDAWGILTTPFGTFVDVLRIHEYVIQIDSIRLTYQTWDSIFEYSRVTSNNYMFMANGIGYPVAIVHADVDTIVKDVEYISDTLCSVWVNISGTISDSSGIVNSGEVSLLRRMSDSTQMPVIATAMITGGNYMFYDIPTLEGPSSQLGKYLIVAQGDSSYPNHIPTYYGDIFRWDSSMTVNTLCFDTIVANIFIIEVPALTGSGFCSGRITLGSKNKTGKFTGEEGGFLGDPVPGLDISIQGIPGGEVKQFTTTNDSGEFLFNNIPVGGYKLFVNIPGLFMDSTYDVTIVNQTDSIYGLNFTVDTTSGSGLIFITTPPTSIRDIMIQTSYSVKVFPNPFSDATVFEIEGGREGETYRLEINDMMGRTVKLIDNISAPPTGQAGTIELNKGELTPGLYFYKVLSRSAGQSGEAGLVGLGKLVVQ